MNLKNSKLHILKKLDIETLPGYTNKYYNNSLFGYSNFNIIKNYYLKSLKNYTLILNKKRKLKYIFGINKHKYNLLIKKFYTKTITKLNNINILINIKLDVFLIKLGYFNTINESRQNIKHGHVLINGHKIFSYNFIIKNTDTLSIINYNNITFNNIKIFKKYFNTIKFYNNAVIININTLKSFFLTNIPLKEFFTLTL